MTISVLSKAIPDGGSIYYQQAWRDNVEFHLPYLQSVSGVSTIIVTPSDTIKYTFDFYGLLQAYGQPVNLHYIIMRMNSLKSPTDYDGSFSTITIPNSTYVQRLVAVYQAIQSKTKTIA
ncbi:MAG TPA: hypothetical protein VN081_01200 [Dongiaceae bacterium]|nr:hypothetical protein [Dongiaceae bacterium]